MFKKILLAASGLFAVAAFAVQAYSGTLPVLVPGFTGSYVVQANGTGYFYNPTGTYGQTEVLHFAVAGSATFKNGKNTAVNLTLNLGGEDDYSSAGEYNELICYLTQPGDLFYTAGSGNTPALLTITYQNGDTCGNPDGVGNTGVGPGNGGVSEYGNLIPFNFYPNWNGGVIVSNYTYLTNGGTVSPSYPHGWIDSGSYGTPPNGTGSHVAYGFSVTGQLTPTSIFP
jgi:hypothetical protein